MIYSNHDQKCVKIRYNIGGCYSKINLGFEAR